MAKASTALTNRRSAKNKPARYKERSDDSKLVPKPTGFNNNLTQTNNAFMRMLLGEPRVKKDYTPKDNGLTNVTLAKQMVTDDVGPFRVTGLKQAVESLSEVMSDILNQHPVIHAKLGTAGMLSVRYASDSSSSLSNHSWGTAVDLKIDGLLDRRGDKLTQKGLILIAPIFNKHKWYWGKSFPTEDSMHFDVSAEKLIEWAKAGKLGQAANKTANSPGLLAVLKKKKQPAAKTVQVRAHQSTNTKVNQSKILLKKGDKGPAVYLLQLKLNHSGAIPKLVPDKRFGGNTEETLKDFQRRNGLRPSGVLDRATDDALSSLRITIPTYIDFAARKIQNIMNR